MEYNCFECKGINPNCTNYTYIKFDTECIYHKVAKTDLEKMINPKLGVITLETMLEKYLKKKRAK